MSIEYILLIIGISFCILIYFIIDLYKNKSNKNNVSNDIPIDHRFIIQEDYIEYLKQTIHDLNLKLDKIMDEFIKKSYDLNQSNFTENYSNEMESLKQIMIDLELNKKPKSTKKIKNLTKEKGEKI